MHTSQVWNIENKHWENVSIIPIIHQQPKKKKKLHQFSDGQTTWMDISPNKVYNGNKHMRRCSTLTVIREMQIKIPWDTISHSLG